MRKHHLKNICSAIAFSSSILAASQAQAIPTLQLYIEGSTYDTVAENWYFPGHDFRLWAIGNLSGPGGNGGRPITNVRLAAVYDNPGHPVTITITPAKIGGAGSYNGFTDPSLSGVATWIRTVTDGSRPLIGGSTRLPAHGEYGAGRIWQEFALPSFTVADSQSADFINAFPMPGAANTAQIHAYDVHVVGADAHFDLYAQTTDRRGRVSYINAPFSHDATDGPVNVPIPATLALLGIGAMGLGACRRGAKPAAK